MWFLKFTTFLHGGLSKPGNMDVLPRVLKRGKVREHAIGFPVTLIRVNDLSCSSVGI